MTTARDGKLAYTKRTIARWIRRALIARGLDFNYLEMDFDDRPIDEYSQQRMLDAMSICYKIWVEQQAIFEVNREFDVSVATREFFNVWMKTPFRGRQGGSRFNNLLWLYLMTISYNPEVVVDSGTYKGASAWAFRLACPDIHIASFDIDLSQLVMRCDGVEYFEHDWSHWNAELGKNVRKLVYFDDHVDQVRRIVEASEKGFQLAIFDDDYPITSFYTMSPSPSVLPKIEFALDPMIVDGTTLEWLFHGKPQSFRIDRQYLDQGRSCIRATERLPNTSLITGIHQTPYRIISVT